MDEHTRIAVVTGGGSGIGAATGLALAGRGWTVIAAGRHQDTLDAVAGRAGDMPGTVRGRTVDVTSGASVRDLFAWVAAEYGRVDLLFNNAGMSAPAAQIDDLPIDTWNTVLAVNVTGMFLCARAAFHLMRTQDPRGGRIINNGSISAVTPRPQAVAYNTTKHAVTGLTKSLSLDGRQFDISCCQINIGNASTDMTSSMSQGVLQADGRIASEPTMDVRHVADAVCVMAALPPAASIYEMTIMATAMPFVGRG